MTRKTMTLTVYRLHLVEETDDDQPPSLPPFPVVETDGAEVQAGLAKTRAAESKRRSA